MFIGICFMISGLFGLASWMQESKRTQHRLIGITFFVMGVIYFAASFL
jgi:uncharacterized membrane protein HdeD (DUF308 family)